MEYDFEIQAEVEFGGTTYFQPLAPIDGYSTYAEYGVMFGYQKEDHEASWSEVEYSDPLTADSYQVMCYSDNAQGNYGDSQTFKVLTL